MKLQIFINLVLIVLQVVIRKGLEFGGSEGRSKRNQVKSSFFFPLSSD